MSTKMTTEEREQFLADLHVGVIGIARKAGPPLTVPVWYDYQPGGSAWVITGPDSLKGRLMQNVEKVSLCAQNESMPYRYVSIEGSFTTRPATADELLAMAVRYLGEAGGRAYVANAGHEDNMTVVITPETWFTVDYGKTMSA